MISYILVALGGALGSLLRYGAAVFFGGKPLTTFGVNVIGSFFIGLLTAVTADIKVRLLFGTGLLGGFTTFSAWQLEALSAVQSESSPKSVFWILCGSLAAGFIACFGGYTLGQRLR